MYEEWRKEQIRLERLAGKEGGTSTSTPPCESTYVNDSGRTTPTCSSTKLEEEPETVHNSNDGDQSVSNPGDALCGEDIEKERCAHRRFWGKVRREIQCSGCSISFKKYAFQCPDCGIIACASCKIYLCDVGA